MEYAFPFLEGRTDWDAILGMAYELEYYELQYYNL